jgi:hypothetical protein
MTSRSPEQARKRYYLVRDDLTDKSPGYEFENRSEVLVDGRLAGTHEHRVPGHPMPVLVGIPPLRGKPRLVLGGSGKRARDYYGSNPVFISSRAKRLIEGIDPDGFEFVECETVTRTGDSVEPYWWANVVRWVDKFDEARSGFEWTRDRFPDMADAQNNPSMFRLYDIRMPEGFPADSHAFWLAHYLNYAVFDEVIVDAWRAAGLTGAIFTPLQPPTQAERKLAHLFVNAPYWTEKARQT